MKIEKIFTLKGGRDNRLEKLGSVMEYTTDNMTKIRTGKFPNANLECCHNTNLLCRWMN